MKIAFTSCIDTVNDPVQDGWVHLTQLAPTHLVLLGDTIYMDYGLGNHKPNGSPRDEPLDSFSRLMYESYKAQWEVPNFRDPVKRCEVVLSIWDDHDFAWNNARGGGNANGKDYVSGDYRRLSRLQFETFRQTLKNKPPSYPSNPSPTGVVADDLGSIAQTVPLSDGVALHLIDARSFREEKGGSMLGAAQRGQLQSSLLGEPDINIIASSSTFEGWGAYPVDHAWLQDMAKTHRILVLSGDVHKPDFQVRARLYEATASAMAQPPDITAKLGKETHVFGILGFESDRLMVEIFVGANRVQGHAISRSTWSVSPL